MHNWTGDPPNLYDISGSAHFINKCDNGIVVHRNRDPDAGPIDQVKVRIIPKIPSERVDSHIIIIKFCRRS